MDPEYAWDNRDSNNYNGNDSLEKSRCDQRMKSRFQEDTCFAYSDH